MLTESERRVVARVARPAWARNLVIGLLGLAATSVAALGCALFKTRELCALKRAVEAAQGSGTPLPLGMSEVVADTSLAMLLLGVCAGMALAAVATGAVLKYGRIIRKVTSGEATAEKDHITNGST